MHELGLVYQVVKTVDEVVKKNGLAEVDEIVLQVGEMSDVVPSSLKKHGLRRHLPPIIRRQK